MLFLYKIFYSVGEEDSLDIYFYMSGKSGLLFSSYKLYYIMLLIIEFSEKSQELALVYGAPDLLVDQLGSIFCALFSSLNVSKLLIVI